MKKKKSLREWLSIMIAKNPSRVILLIITLFNILFMLISALMYGCGLRRRRERGAAC